MSTADSSTTRRRMVFGVCGSNSPRSKRHRLPPFSTSKPLCSVYAAAPIRQMNARRFLSQDYLPICAAQFHRKSERNCQVSPRRYSPNPGALHLPLTAAVTVYSPSYSLHLRVLVQQSGGASIKLLKYTAVTFFP